MEKIFEVEIQKLVYGGDGMGRLPDGRAIFIPFSLPGEIIQTRLVEERKAYARGEVIRILHASPDRIVPRCRHFGMCKGCQYQQVDYQNQLEIKRAAFQEQLARIAGMITLPDTTMTPSPEEWNYLNEVRFSLTSSGNLGFLQNRTSEILPISECHLPDPTINDLWPQLNFEPMTNITAIGIGSGIDGDSMVVIEGDDNEIPELELDLPISVVHLSPSGSTVLAGDGFRILEVNGAYFRVSAGMNFPSNNAVAGKMVDTLLEIMNPNKDSVLVDLFCGIGLYAKFLALKTKNLLGVEPLSVACEDFAANLDDFENVDLYEGTPDIILPSLRIPVNTILIEAPDGGLKRSEVEAIIRTNSPKLVYISSDPPTFARDTKILLSSGYHLEKSFLFDSKPQTYVVESINFFSH